MKEFTNSMPFIIFFLVLTILLQTFTNSKLTNGFLGITLVSMIVLNSDKIKNLLNEVKMG